MANTDYHYVITIQFQTGGGVGVVTTQGVVTAGENSTREGLYRDVCKFACDESGIDPQGVSVLFFTMGRNDLRGEE